MLLPWQMKMQRFLLPSGTLRMVFGGLTVQLAKSGTLHVSSPLWYAKSLCLLCAPPYNQAGLSYHHILCRVQDATGCGISVLRVTHQSSCQSPLSPPHKDWKKVCKPSTNGIGRGAKISNGSFHWQLYCYCNPSFAAAPQPCCKLDDVCHPQCLLPVLDRKLKQGEVAWANVEKFWGWLSTQRIKQFGLQPQNRIKSSKLYATGSNSQNAKVAFCLRSFGWSCAKASARVLYNPRGKRTTISILCSTIHSTMFCLPPQ